MFTNITADKQLLVQKVGKLDDCTLACCKPPKQLLVSPSMHRATMMPTLTSTSCKEKLHFCMLAC